MHIDQGRAFREVLQSLIRIKDPVADVPVPENGRWLHAGEILGDGYSLAWRVLDAAQGWGVAQRRKRIFAVLDLDGQCAGKVLFESEGLSGYTPPGGEARKGAARGAEGSAGAAGELSLNGYIDDEVWFGDEITPESLHEALYGKENQLADDVHIRLNSYGGSCNAAVRMYDDVRAYPGSVRITVSGTAASAATVLAMAADRLEMTPGSLWMIHDPSVVAWGNERELMDSIRLLQACKESILNVYQRRCQQSRQEVAAMMSATSWLDAQSALQYGFIDAISEDGKPGAPENAGKRRANLDFAKAKVQAWQDRHKPRLTRAEKQETTDEAHPSMALPDEEQTAVSGGMGEAVENAADVAPPEPSGIPVTQLQRRLDLLMPASRRYEHSNSNEQSNDQKEEKHHEQNS